jgi:two-component system sensor histidine kinase TorS
LAPEALSASLNRLCRASGVADSVEGTLADLGPDHTSTLVAMMLDRLRPEAEAIARAVRAGDSEALSRLTHQLKGAVGNFDMPDLVARLSRLGRGDPLPGAEVDAFLSAVERAERDLAATLKALSGPLRLMPAAQ